MTTGNRKIYVDGEIFSLQRAGGISRIFNEMLPIMSRHDVITLYLGLYKNCNIQSNNNLCKIGLCIDTDNRYINRLFALLNRCGAQVLWQIFSVFDYRYYISSYYSVPFSIRSGSRFVLFDYDCAHENYPELFPGADELIRKKKRALDAADLVLTISESSKQDLIKFHQIDENKIKVVYLAAEKRLLSPAPSDLPKKYLLFVGSRASYKNFDKFFSVYKESLAKEFNLVVVGGGEIHGDGIYYFEPDEHLLATLYTKASVLVYPSDHEGFGLPPLEALMYDCPVVLSSKNATSREIIRDHATYVNVNNRPDFSQAIRRAALTDQKARLSARNYAETFTWKKSVETFNTHIVNFFG